MLDAYVAAGGNFIDTADVYSAWAPGNDGGESETDHRQLDGGPRQPRRVVLATKVGRLPGAADLARGHDPRAAEASLERLRTDHIDLYYAHSDDDETPLAETLGAFDALVDAGKVRHIAASNYAAAAARRGAASSRETAGSPRYAALQPHYNLVDRAEYEGDAAPTSARARARLRALLRAGARAS